MTDLRRSTAVGLSAMLIAVAALAACSASPDDGAPRTAASASVHHASGSPTSDPSSPAWPQCGVAPLVAWPKAGPLLYVPEPDDAPSALNGHVRSLVKRMLPDVEGSARAAQGHPCVLRFSEGHVTVSLVGDRRHGYSMSELYLSSVGGDSSRPLGIAGDTVTVGLLGQDCAQEPRCAASLTARYGDAANEASTQVGTGQYEMSVRVQHDATTWGSAVLKTTSPGGDLLTLWAHRLPPGDFAAG